MNVPTTGRYHNGFSIIPTEVQRVRNNRFSVLLLAILASALSACAIPTDKDKADLANGFTQYTQRQFSPAGAIASNYIQKFPNDEHIDEAYYLRGLARQGTGDKVGATQDLTAAIAKTKRLDLKSKANRALGDLAFDAQRWDDAIAFYQASIKDVPEPIDSFAYARLGASLQALGKWDEARSYFLKVIETNADPALTQRAIVRKNARSFELQFGAYQDAANARTLAAQLKTEAIVAIPTSELRDGKLWYLVRSGAFHTYAEADLARKRYLPKHPLIIIVP